VTVTVPIVGPHAAAPADEVGAAGEYLSNGAGNGTQRKTA
jgi:hypothetical protein